MRTRVLAVGGGPVGLTLAMDLAWRGIDVIVAERRLPNDPPNVKCGQIGARSMEIFRRLGVADKLRGIGLPAAYPNDIVSATSVTGIELSRVLIPGRGARGTPAAAGPDTTWPTPEHTHRCNQKFSSRCCSRTLRSSRASASCIAPRSQTWPRAKRV